MTITIYKTNGSPPARAVLMTIEVLGLEIEKKDINTSAQEHRQPEYLEKNPTHTIPLLEDGDFILADSHAIITYLVSKYGGDLQETLYPSDLKIRATIDHRLYVDATLLFPNLRSIMMSIFMDKAPGPNAKQTADIHEAYGFIEKYLERSEFLAADHITLADISVVGSISSMDVFVPLDPEKFPKVTDWWGKLKAKDWYQKANVPGLTQVAGYVKAQMESNAKNN